MKNYHKEALIRFAIVSLPYAILITLAISGWIKPPHEHPLPSVEYVQIEHAFDDLLDAIEWVESRGDPWAIGDNGDAVGSFQIHKIYVDDVNRVKLIGSENKLGKFKYSDRYSPRESRTMVTIFLKHYGGTFEEMARKHNGGPNGHRKESTKEYWLKVKARMDERRLCE